MSTISHFIVEQFRQPPLEFDGEMIADVSSRLPDSNRWQEIRIYRTVNESFVTEVVGRSTVTGEHDLRFVKKWRRPDQVHRGLVRRQHGREFYTPLALEALRVADDVVSGIDVGDYTERID